MLFPFKAFKENISKLWQGTLLVFYFFFIQASIFKPSDAYISNILLHLSQANKIENSNLSSLAAMPLYLSIHDKQNCSSSTAIDLL